VLENWFQEYFQNYVLIKFQSLAGPYFLAAAAFLYTQGNNKVCDHLFLLLVQIPTFYKVKPTTAQYSGKTKIHLFTTLNHSKNKLFLKQKSCQKCCSNLFLWRDLKPNHGGIAWLAIRH
jgi:hypothetical protein